MHFAQLHAAMACICARLFLLLFVGLTWEEAHRRCPEGVVPACYNSADTQTVSGPAEAVSEFVSQLKKEGIFAKEVNSAGVAFHSHFMKKAAPALKAALSKVYISKMYSIFILEDFLHPQLYFMFTEVLLQ